MYIYNHNLDNCQKKLLEKIRIFVATTPSKLHWFRQFSFQIPMSRILFLNLIFIDPMSISESLTTSEEEEEEEEEVDGIVFTGKKDPSFYDIINYFEMASLGEGLVDSGQDDDKDDNQLMFRRDFKKFNREINVVLRSLDSNTQSAPFESRKKVC